VASFYAWRRHLHPAASHGGGSSKQSSTEAASQSMANEDQGSNASGFVSLDAQADASSEMIEG
jgi:hypothetical protein